MVCCGGVENLKMLARTSVRHYMVAYVGTEFNWVRIIRTRMSDGESAILGYFRNDVASDQAQSPLTQYKADTYKRPQILHK